MKTPLRPLTDEEKDFIRENYQMMNRLEMSVQLGAPFKRVDEYCRTQKLIRRKYYVAREKTFPKSTIKRPPAVYSNISRDEHIDKWLNA